MSTADSVKDDDSCNKSTDHGVDFTFGFNDVRFADRVLVIEVIADDVTHQSADKADDSIGSKGCIRVREVHVSCLLLAAKSPFFHKLFSNGMMESQQRRVTLRIHAAEETAVMDVLNYMYSGTLTSGTSHALLDVLKLADKFQVVSCMRLCPSLLTKLPMSTESALLYLDLPSNLTMADEVQLLVDAAKQFLEVQYKDIDKVRDEIMEMPLAGIKAVLSSDVLRVSTEDEVFDIVLKWTETHYPKLKDQRKILSAHLAQYIRFPYMSLEKLTEVQTCNVLNDDFAHKAVVDALVHKIKTPHHHRTNSKAAIEGSTSTNCCPFARRDYQWWPIKVLEFEFPRRELVVYFELTFDECADLNPSESIMSESFGFRGQPYYFSAECERDKQSRTYFSVGLTLDGDRSATHVFDYEFAFRSKCTKQFVVVKSGSLDFTADDGITIHKTPWVDFKAGKGGLDFIDGILYIELRLRIMQ